MTATDPLEARMRALYADVAADIEAGRSNYWCPCHGGALTWCPAWEEAVAWAADYERRRVL